MSEKSNLQGKEQIDPKAIEAISGQAISSLLRAVQSSDEEVVTCAEAREHIASLYEMNRAKMNRAEMNRAGATLPPHLQAVSLHVASCPDCTLEYEALAETMNAFAAGTLPELSEDFAFDLSFLRPSPTTPPAQKPLPWRESLTQGVWALGEAVLIQVETTRATFASLQEYLRPPQTADALFRSEADNSSARAEELLLPISEAAFNVHLAIGPVVAQHTTVALKLLEQSSAQPLVNLQVTLRNRERQLLTGSMTDQAGSVLFEHLSLGYYLIQIRRQQRLWEIPLVLV